MGQEPSKPEAGRSMQVICGGLPRTGTASFSEALSILLKGPVYHGGTQMTIGAETNVVGWIDVLEHCPIESEADRKQVMEKVKKLTSGYVAMTDTPAHLFIEELMDIYPDAKVVCTTRDPDRWVESIEKLAKTSLQGFLRFALFWLPGLRYFPDYIEALNAGRWGELYGRSEENLPIYDRRVWSRHMEYLSRTVPKDKLIFFDVKDGWKPLCHALELPVPEGIEFPNINDGEAADRFAKKQIQRGVLRWAVVISIAVIVLGSAL